MYTVYYLPSYFNNITRYSFDVQKKNWILITELIDDSFKLERRVIVTVDNKGNITIAMRMNCGGENETKSAYVV